MVKLVEFYRYTGSRGHLDEIWINPLAVVAIRPERSDLVQEAYDHLGVSKDVEFSRIMINEYGSTRNIIVVGSPEEIKTKLNFKKLLRG